MRRVCVIGGGTAGKEAAMEAERDGAEVTVLERSKQPELPWKVWPGLIENTDPLAEETRRPRLTSAVEFLRTVAIGVQGRSVLSSDGAVGQFDSVVVATGSDFAPLPVRGHRKPGVHVLRSSYDYSELGRRHSSIDRAVVAGEGRRALEISTRLGGQGREVVVVVSGWRHRPSPDILRVLKGAALEMGVSITDGKVERVVGEGSVEAVVVGGGVLPCDTVALLPHRIPRLIPTDVTLGPRGGLSVDRGLQTSSSSTLAAGGCAELPLTGASSHIFDEEPGMSGRIAGANAVGHSLQASATERWEVDAFDLRWSGVDFEPFLEAPWRPSLCTVSRRWGSESACAITFERQGGRVFRVQSVEPSRAPALDASLMSVPPSSLGSLAYGGSSDISLVSDTARLGLQLWSNS